MLLGKVSKQPVESIDVDLNYSAFFLAGQDDDNVVSNTVASTRTQTGSTDAAASLTVSSRILDINGGTANAIRLLIGGGLTGEQYKLEITMTGKNVYGRVIQDEVIVSVKAI